MAKHSVITTNAEIDRAIGQAKGLRDELRVVSAEFKPGAELDLIILKFSDGHRLLIPREDLQGLRGAAEQQIAKMQILGNGTGIRWPMLDLDHYVPNLLRQVYGTRTWMAELGRIGGAVRSVAKLRASRSNGLKGGRPRKHGMAKISA